MQNETAQRSILVVDEDLAFARGLVEMLQSRGFAASAAASHQEALASCGSRQPDLALIDWGSPLGAGLALGDTLRTMHDVPFMILSSLDDAETARRATEAGALAYLVKSAHMHHWLTTIRAALSHADELRVLKERETQLTRALQQTRAISMATGALMERSRLNRDEAFDRLRGLSRAQRRRLSEVAEQLLDAVENLNAVIAALVPPSDERVDS